MIRHRTLVALAATLAAALPAAAQDVSAGEQLFYDYACYSCHGFNGTGRTPLDMSRSGILGDEQTFLTFLRLRADQNPLLPSERMPNYPETSLSDADARAIYAYIVSFQKEPPALEDAPALAAILEAAEAGD